MQSGHDLTTNLRIISCREIDRSGECVRWFYKWILCWYLLLLHYWCVLFILNKASHIVKKAAVYLQHAANKDGIKYTFSLPLPFRHSENSYVVSFLSHSFVAVKKPWSCLFICLFFLLFFFLIFIAWIKKYNTIQRNPDHQIASLRFFFGAKSPKLHA